MINDLHLEEKTERLSNLSKITQLKSDILKIQIQDILLPEYMLLSTIPGLLKLSTHQNHQEGLLKHIFLVPITGISGAIGLV